ncbi:hypothetical protein [Desulfobacula sp.]|uniref:hypothetical protein n=1 Tax=Desulfobacula sp. TaxID=2593537 RepID=UPI002714C55E|nr:hypothetical protein [Desulfobacula sp.]
MTLNLINQNKVKKEGDKNGTSITRGRIGKSETKGVDLFIHLVGYTLLVKNLMEEGVDLEKVKKASDKAWAILGQQAAEQLKPLFGETVNIEALRQSGAMASSIHGMEISEKVTENMIQSEYTKCPGRMLI